MREFRRAIGRRGALAEFAGYAFGPLGPLSGCVAAHDESANREATPFEPRRAASGRAGPDAADAPDMMEQVAPVSTIPWTDSSDPEAAFPMSKSEPPRPPGPPRPSSGARPRPQPASRPAGPRPNPRPPAPMKMWSPEAPTERAQGGTEWSPEAPTERAGAGAPPGEALKMVPLHGEDKPVSGKGGATSFFALPAPRRKDPSSDEPASDLKRSDPIAAASAQSAAPASAPPGTPAGGYVPAGAVPAAPVMMPMGISGPVANAPGMHHAAGMPAPAAMPADLQQDVQRARSYRVFAIVMMLMAMVFSVMVAAVILIFSVVFFRPDGPSSNQPVAVINPVPPPNNARVDTGVVAPPIPKAAPKPRSSPRPRSTTPKPAAAPKPPPSSPGQLKVTLAPGSPVFTSIEIVCETASGKYRQRAPFNGGTASRADVPRSECTMFFKGGPPASVKVRGGQTLTCAFVGQAPSCK